jgi:hypothetical protein
MTHENRKRAAAILRRSKVYLHPYSQTTEGFWIFSDPVLVMEPTDRNAGALIRSVLLASKTSVPHPTSWKDLTAPLLRAASVKSFDALVRGAKTVELYFDGELVKYVPTRNAGPGQAFLHMPEKSLASPIQDEEVLGSTLSAAFELCE